MNIPLPRELEKLVARLVESGRYSSPADVVREALRTGIAKGVRDSRRGKHHDGDRVFDQLKSYAIRAVRR